MPKKLTQKRQKPLFYVAEEVEMRKALILLIIFDQFRKSSKVTDCPPYQVNVSKCGIAKNLRTNMSMLQKQQIEGNVFGEDGLCTVFISIRPLKKFRRGGEKLKKFS